MFLIISYLWNWFVWIKVIYPLQGSDVKVSNGKLQAYVISKITATTPSGFEDYPNKSEECFILPFKTITKTEVLPSSVAEGVHINVLWVWVEGYNLSHDWIKH